MELSKSKKHDELIKEHVPDLVPGMKWEEALPLITQALEDYAANIRRLIREKAWFAEKHSLLKDQYNALNTSYMLLKAREQELERQLAKAILKREGIGR